jgi:hypothetical protein
MTVFIGRVDIATVNSAKQFLSSKSTPIRKNFYVEVLPPPARDNVQRYNMRSNQRLLFRL